MNRHAKLRRATANHAVNADAPVQPFYLARGGGGAPVTLVRWASLELRARQDEIVSSRRVSRYRGIAMRFIDGFVGGFLAAIGVGPPNAIPCAKAVGRRRLRTVALFCTATNRWFAAKPNVEASRKSSSLRWREKWRVTVRPNPAFGGPVGWWLLRPRVGGGGPLNLDVRPHTSMES